MNLPDKIRQLCRMGPVFLVGGFVRDTILNRASNDYDFVVAGDAEAFAERVAEQLGTRVIRMGKGRKVDYRIVSGRIRSILPPWRVTALKKTCAGGISPSMRWDTISGRTG